MSDAAATPAKAPAKSPKKKTPAKPKAPAPHPTYKEMVIAAITTLKERGGSSRIAIVKYIQANYKVNNDLCNARTKQALKRNVGAGTIKQVKGTGAAGSFSIGQKKVEKPKKPAGEKKKVAKKPAKKPAAAKKSPAKKPAAKKSPAKKPAAKKPAAKKPAAKKSPAKKAAAKKPVAKKPAKK